MKTKHEIILIPTLGVVLYGLFDFGWKIFLVTICSLVVGYVFGYNLGFSKKESQILKSKNPKSF